MVNLTSIAQSVAEGEINHAWFDRHFQSLEELAELGFATDEALQTLRLVRMVVLPTEEERVAAWK